MEQDRKLWDLTREELMDAVNRMLRDLNVPGSGQSYDVRVAIYREWKKARQAQGLPVPED